MKTYYALVCKIIETGVVYLNPTLLESHELQEHAIYLKSIGVEVIDVKIFNFDSTGYEHL